MNDTTLAAGCEPRCRGCAHRAFSAEESIARKRAWLAKALAPWAENLKPIIAPVETERWHYRDKVCLASAWDGARWQFGLMVRDELLPIPACPIHSPRVEKTLAVLSSALPEATVFPLRYYVQAGAQATLVLKTQPPPPRHWLTPSIAMQLNDAGIEGLWLHHHAGVGRRVFAKNTWQLVHGEARSRDAAGLLYGPAAFQQLIPRLYRAALDEANDWLAPAPGVHVADLYCGNGASLRRWRECGAETMGVELSGEAVACALDNVPEATVLRGTCEARLPQLREWCAGARDLRIFANPPRTGIEPAVLDWIIREARPRRIAYLSCSVGTLGRDLSALEAAGYGIERITPYDFFPQTHHVETLALLRRAD